MDNSLGNRDGIKKVFLFLFIFVLVIFIAINAFQYFFNVNITAYVSGLVSDKPKMNIVVDQDSKDTSDDDSDDNGVPELAIKQVYNIPGNHYNYENAKALCTAYGSQLATYNQIEQAYKSGAEWCNYGWSEGQNAYFPTQQKTYDNLQKIEGHEHDCGRPGINGGYIANPNVRFGVNCYGNKPKITKEEQDLMENTTPYPETAKDRVFQKRVDFWKQNLDKILVSPFNYDTWGSL